MWLLYLSDGLIIIVFHHHKKGHPIEWAARVESYLHTAGLL